MKRHALALLPGILIAASAHALPGSTFNSHHQGNDFSSDTRSFAEKSKPPGDPWHMSDDEPQDGFKEGSEFGRPHDDDNLSSFKSHDREHKHWDKWHHASPVPEPTTYVLMLAGLGGVAMAVRRRRKQG